MVKIFSTAIFAMLLQLLVAPSAAVVQPSIRPSVTAATTPATKIAHRPLPLKIGNVWYDAAEHAETHPGGRWLLEYSRGRDVTALYRATHLFGEQRAAASLATLARMDDAAWAASGLRQPSRANLPPSRLAAEGAEHGAEPALQGAYVFSLDATRTDDDNPNLPPIDSALRDELQAFLRRRFPTRASMKATPAHWARTAAALGATLACWAGWLHGGVLATLLLPACQWVLAAHTVHEATHGALSTDARINYVAQFTAHPILFNVFVWIPQHLMSHHQYTNDHDLDVDVHHFAPAKLAAAQPAVGNTPGAGDGPPPNGLVARLTTLDGSTWNEGWTFVWKGCLTTLGTSVLQPLRTLTEKPTPNFDANITPVPAAVSKRTLLLSMLPSFFVLLYPLAALALGWVSAPVALLLEVWPWVGMSMIWTAMTQTSHVQAQCQPDEGSPLQRSCWTARQIQTSLDYSAGEPWPTYLTAGLNSQGLHHAMPAVSCCHFPEIYGEYREICARHGVEVRESENLATAVGEMFEYVFDLNAPAAEGHAPVASD